MNEILNFVKRNIIAIFMLCSCAFVFATETRPDWIDDVPESGDYIYAVGIGEGAKLEAARESALQDARVQLSKTIEKKVTNMCKDFIKHSNGNNSDNLSNYSSDLSKNVAKNVIVGAELKDSYVADGKVKQYYALMAVRSKTLSLSIEETKAVMDTKPDYRAVERDLESMVSSIKSRYNSEMAEKAKTAKANKKAVPEVTVKEGKEPNWVKRFPNDKGFYIGIGQGSNLEGAKANAVNTVVSQIKVGIQSEVKDYMSETNGVSDEDVSVNIKLSVKDNIEDVEYYDAWQSPKGEFWVYARLNIATYQRKQLEKLENAKMVAMDYLKKSDEEELPVLAFKDAFLGYYFISPYVTKAVRAMYKGKEVIVINELLAKMNKITNKISIVQADDSLMMGKINAKPLKVDFTLYGNDERMGNLPVIFSVEDDAAQITTDGVTNADGEVTCVVTKALTNETSFTLTATPDFESLVKGLIDDPEQQKYFAKKVAQIPVPKKQVVIEVERPTFGFKTTVKDAFTNADYSSKVDNLATGFKNKFSDKMKSEFVEDDAQYTIEMIVSGTVVNSDGDSNFIFARMIVTYKIYDNSTGTEIYSKVSDEVKQGANTDIKAVQKAVDKYISSNLNGIVNEMVKKGIN